MDWHTWIAYFVACWIIAVSPGSGAVLSMSHGLSYGVRKSSATIFGLQLGLLTILLIAGAGVGSLLLASEWAFNAVKIVGACYLIYLGISQWRSGAAPLATQESMPELSVRRRVLTGFLTNWPPPCWPWTPWSCTAMRPAPARCAASCAARVPCAARTGSSARC